MTIRRVELPILFTKGDLLRFFWDRTMRARAFRRYAFWVTCLCLCFGVSAKWVVLGVIWSGLLVMPFLVGMVLAHKAWKVLLESDEREKWKYFITEQGIEKHQAGQVELVPWASVSSLTNSRTYIYATRARMPILLVMKRHLSEDLLAEVEGILRQVSQDRQRQDM